MDRKCRERAGLVGERGGAESQLSDESPVKCKTEAIRILDDSGLDGQAGEAGDARCRKV